MRLKRLLHRQRWGMFVGWVNEDAVAAAGGAQEETASEVAAGSAVHEATQN